MKHRIIDIILYLIGGGAIYGGFIYDQHYRVKLVLMDLLPTQSIPHNYITPGLILIGVIIIVNHVLYSKGITATNKTGSEDK